MKRVFCRRTGFSSIMILLCLVATTPGTAQQIIAVLQDNEVWGHGWTAEEPIEVRIGQPGDWSFMTNTTAGSGGNWDIDTNPLEIQAGQIIQVEGGTTGSREHEVYYLTVVEVDTVADLVNGAADPDRDVLVKVHGEDVDVSRHVTADNNGHWSADFTGEGEHDQGYNIEEGTSGSAHRFDSEGHQTELRWYVPHSPEAHFNVTPRNNHLWGHEWPANDTVTIKQGDPAEIIGTAETDEWGEFWFDSPVDIHAGDLLQVECGEILKSHVVTELTVTAADAGNDTVSGTAYPGSSVSVGVHGADVYRHVEADENGDWIADFSDAVGSEPWEGAYDLTAGDDGYARQDDEDGNATHVHWFLEQPRFSVEPRSNHLWGHEWPANDTVTIKQGDPAEIIGTAETDEWGEFWFDSPVDIHSGDLLQVECGEILKSHVVTELTVTAVDAGNDTVSGTAYPGSSVSVGVHGVDVYRHVEADENGKWIADFSDAVGSEPWDGAYDLTAGDDGYAMQEDKDSDSTHVSWFVADPFLFVDLYENTIRGHGWPSGAEVVVTIGAPADPDHIETMHANVWGDWWLHLYHDLHILQAGDLVTADAGTHRRAMTVPVLEITDVDPDNNMVGGRAADGSEVAVTIGEVTIYVTANEHDEWKVDFSGDGVDIQEGTEGRLTLHDEHGNVTEMRWRYATLDVMDISMIKASAEEWGWHVFLLEMEVDGLLGAKFKAPSGEWYDVLHEWDKWWFFEKGNSSMDAVDAEFEPGEYELELTHYHGVTKVILEFSENVERPNATPVVIAPQPRLSDVDPVGVEFLWENVENPNFNSIIVSVEDEYFDGDEDDDRYEAFLTIDNGMPTQHIVPELRPDRLYLGDVIFANIEEREYSGDIEVDYAVIYATLAGTVFSTNTDESLFDPIDRVYIERGRWGEDEYLFEFEVEFSERLQVPGEHPLFYRLELWTPEDDFYTLFDSTQHSQFGDLVEFEIAAGNLDDLPGSGWYALVVQQDDESAVATWFLFAEPDSENPLPMPEQTPVIKQPQANDVVANPLTFAWDPVNDENVNFIGIYHTPDNFAVLGADAGEYSPPEDLPVGPQHFVAAFANAHLDLTNDDNILYDISQYSAAGVDFTIGYILVYEAGAGGWLEGKDLQVVAPGGSGEPVEAMAEDGAVFRLWDDGYENAVRTDDGVHADANLTAQFSSEGGVPIDWYAYHDLEPGDHETWAHLDDKDPHGKGMTLAQEFIALTEPNDPGSRFVIGEVDKGPTHRIWFKPSSSGRMYTLRYTEDLTSGVWVDVEGQDPRPGIDSDDDFMEFEGTEVPRFYRIKVEVP